MNFHSIITIILFLLQHLIKCLLYFTICRGCTLVGTIFHQSLKHIWRPTWIHLRRTLLACSHRDYAWRLKLQTVFSKNSLIGSLLLWNLLNVIIHVSVSKIVMIQVWVRLFLLMVCKVQLELLAIWCLCHESDMHNASFAVPRRRMHSSVCRVI